MRPAPLAGVRLLSLALNVPGPVAVARLIAEGATAVKVEPPDGDPLSRLAPPWYRQLHAGVVCRTLDLKEPAGRVALAGLLAETDVMITSQRPAALERLGLASTHLQATVPGLRSVRIVGDTRAPERAGHDLTYLAEAGLLADRLPVTLLADLAGAERVVSAVLLVLRSPQGSTIEVGLRDAVEALTPPLAHGLTSSGGILGGGLPAYGVYAARDGHVAVAALEPHFRSRLYDALALALDAPLAGVMSTRTTAEWEAFAATHDVPIAVVRPRR